jgi:hypothetical protein
MDEQKDIQKTDALAKFIDGQTVRTNPLGDNRAAERSYKRAERIVAGIYLLTGHLPSGEPLKERTRAEAIELLSKTLALRDEMRALESGAVISFQTSIRYLISLVRMLTAGGFVSFQNADAVIAALDELGTFLSASQRSVFSESLSFSKDDFNGRSGGLGDMRMNFLKDTRNIKDKVSVTDSESVSVRTPSRDNLMHRAQEIVETLKSGKELGIKDICAYLPEYSEKMIQRELTALVASGRIKKTGLKRWSRYSIATS